MLHECILLSIVVGIAKKVWSSPPMMATRWWSGVPPGVGRWQTSLMVVAVVIGGVRIS